MIRLQRPTLGRNEKENRNMIKRGFKILKTSFGVIANTPALVPDFFYSICFESLLTDFNSVEEIPYSDNLDFTITMLEDKGSPLDISITEGGINLTGSILEATNTSSDLRFTLFGNEGLLFRYVLMVLEKKYGTFSLHACSLYDEETNHMVIAPGGAGSGKTCLILKGVELGLKLFSTEMTHFSFDNGFILHNGSLIDNIRIGNLKYSYPAVTKTLNIQLPEAEDEWGKKIPVDLSGLQTNFDSISDTRITVLLPHIEERRDRCIAIDIQDSRTSRKTLFDNISEKIAENVVYYDNVPLGGLDNPVLMKNRFQAVDKFLGRVNRVVKIIAGSQNCWEGILDR